MVECKCYLGNNTIKNGHVWDYVCYRCKDCRYNFIERDRRVKESTAIKKALVFILYTLGKALLRY